MFKHVSAGLTLSGILVLSAWVAAPALAEGRSFTAKLEPNRAILRGETKARGTAKFQLSADGRTLRYQVDAFDLDAVSQIHIHMGQNATTPEGVHYHLTPQEGLGTIAGYLLELTPDAINANGTVAQGALTAADLIGPLRGQPLKLLVDHMSKGWSYVNVHIRHDYGQGNRYCCPSGVRGVIWPNK